MRVNGERDFQIAGAENLDFTRSAADHPAAAQRFGSNDVSSGEGVERLNIDDRKFLRCGIVEATLGDAPVYGRYRPIADLRSSETPACCTPAAECSAGTSCC